MQTYNRVIPRDFFNEAKLLKCMGQLALKILDNKTPCIIEIEDNNEPFNIGLTDDGSLSVINYAVYVKGVSLNFKTTYNSKASFPLYCEYEGEEITVFDDKGEFHTDFIQAFT